MSNTSNLSSLISDLAPTIGIDLDNTLICYENAYRKLAEELGLEVGNEEDCRKAVKDHCFAKPEGNLEWTLLQGRLYGEYIQKAELFDGVLQAIQSFLSAGYQVKIISHKTIYSAVGPVYNFHEAATEYIERNIVSNLNIEQQKQFLYVFCQTLDEKVLEIRNSGCSVFIDDLESVLNHPLFPEETQKIHFQNNEKNNWNSLVSRLLPLDSFLPSCLSPSVSHRLSPLTTFSSLLQSLDEELEDITPLSGGINNKVYQLICKSGETYCGKYYKRDPKDSRDRMLHEIRFLEYCSENDINCVPEVYAADWDNGAAIMTYIDGSLWPENESVPENFWVQCQTFFNELQKYQKTESAKKLPRAAEGAYSIQEHLGWVQKRRDFWRQRAENKELDFETKKLVLEVLEDRYQTTAIKCIKDPDFNTKFPERDLVISPSDFGLHNALVDKDMNLWFIDFEYAGWDDENKAFIDFELQPRYRQKIFDRISEIEKEIYILLSLKWLFIILNLTNSRLQKGKV